MVISLAFYLGWVELSISVAGSSLPGLVEGRGQWISVRVLPLGMEWHPLSVAGVFPPPSAFSSSATKVNGLDIGTDSSGCPVDGLVLSVVVSTRSGDWSRSLAAICGDSSTGVEFEVDVAGPVGAGLQSLSRRHEGEALLLLAGGTGVTAWLPDLAHANCPYHLVWCVQTMADYKALVHQLPPASRTAAITVYITRPGPGSIGPASTAAGLSVRTPLLPAHLPTQPKLIDHGRPGLVASLAGLAVGYYWDSILRDNRMSKGVSNRDDWVGLASYAAIRRCLPVLVIVMFVIVTAEVVRRAAHIYALSWRQNTAVTLQEFSNCPQEAGLVEHELREGLTSNSKEN